MVEHLEAAFGIASQSAILFKSYCQLKFGGRHLDNVGQHRPGHRLFRSAVVENVGVVVGIE